jgi:hypothetical protein
LKVADEWIFNRVESLEVAVKWKLVQVLTGIKQLRRKLSKCPID